MEVLVDRWCSKQEMTIEKSIERNLISGWEDEDKPTKVTEKTVNEVTSEKSGWGVTEAKWIKCLKNGGVINCVKCCYIVEEDWDWNLALTHNLVTRKFLVTK